MEPTGKYLKSYNAGYKAFKEGIALNKNPNQEVGMLGWWGLGWIEADSEAFAKRCLEASAKGSI